MLRANTVKQAIETLPPTYFVPRGPFTCKSHPFPIYSYVYWDLAWLSGRGCKNGTFGKPCFLSLARKAKQEGVLTNMVNMTHNYIAPTKANALFLKSLYLFFLGGGGGTFSVSSCKCRLITSLKKGSQTAVSLFLIRAVFWVLLVFSAIAMFLHSSASYLWKTLRSLGKSSKARYPHYEEKDKM